MRKWRVVDRTMSEERAQWLLGLAVGDPVRVVLPGAVAIEHTRVAAVWPHTIEVRGRATRFARGTGIARGAAPDTGLRLEREEGGA
jgi:hypothetical protein